MEDWDEQKICEMIDQGTSELRVPLAKAKKFAGAITVGVIARALGDCRIPCSTGNVFIKSVPIEFDLLVPRPGITPKYGILYEPRDILAVLEVKKRGSFGADTIAKVREDFRVVRQANPNVMCAYVTITEQKPYRHAVTSEKIGAEAYTFLWHSGSGPKLAYESTGDWARLVGDLRRLLGGTAS